MDISRSVALIVQSLSRSVISRSVVSRSVVSRSVFCLANKLKEVPIANAGYTGRKIFDAKFAALLLLSYRYLTKLQDIVPLKIEINMHPNTRPILAR